MPLKISSNTKGTWITWETPDESLSATFRIKPEMDDSEILKTLVKATVFISRQMGEMEAEISLLEAEIFGAAAAPQSSPASPGHGTAASVSEGHVPSAATRIAMPDPAKLSDRPSDGGPVNSHFGWGSAPTQQVPARLAGEWELIPPGEE